MWHDVILFISENCIYFKTWIYLQCHIDENIWYRWDLNIYKARTKKIENRNQYLIARMILLWGLEIAMVASLSLYCNLILGLKLFQRIHVNASFPRKRIKRFGFTIYSQNCAWNRTLSCWITYKWVYLCRKLLN